MAKWMSRLGALIILAIAPATMMVDSYITFKLHADMAISQEELAKKIGNVDKEAIETEVIAAYYSNTIVANREGYIVSVTPSAAQLFGYMSHELKGQNVNMLMPERYKGSHNLQYLRRVNAEYNPKKIVTIPQCYGLRKDGTEVSVEVRTRTIKIDSELLLIARFIELKDIKVVEPEL